MTFRWKLFLTFTFTIWLAIGLVAAGFTLETRRSFAAMDLAHTDALVAQFQQEYTRRSQEVVQQIKNVADAESTIRMAIDLNRPQADPSVYAHDATGVSQQQMLDFLDFVASDGSVISSAEWPERIGSRMNWVAQPQDWSAIGPFLMRADTPIGPALALMSVAAVRVGEKDLFVAGGEKLGKEFVASLVLPAGTRAFLYRNVNQSFTPSELLDANGPVDDADPLSSALVPVLADEMKQPLAQTNTINPGHDPASAELFHIVPLLGRQKEPLAVLMVGSSQSPVVALERNIILLAIAGAAGGLFFGALLSWWASARVTKPVEKLLASAEQVAGGNWSTHVDVGSKGEVGKLARSFNRMTGQLAGQRERLVQTERVAAWRELARRVADELKDPLVPMKKTVENLRRLHNQDPAQFDAIFADSSDALIGEIEDLKMIVERFGNFGSMPQPELQAVNVNDLTRAALKSYEGEFGAVGRPPITPELHLDDSLPVIQADAVLLQRAFENLVLNAMDAMPSGGMIAVTTSLHDGCVRLEISDTGSGLSSEECQRLFTPYYTTKQHRTGLGLAIVQSVISDHGGIIVVESEKGVGTTVRIDLPNRPPMRKSGAAPNASLSAASPVKNSAQSLPERAATPTSAPTPLQDPVPAASTTPWPQSIISETSALDPLQSQIMETAALPDSMPSVAEPPVSSVNDPASSEVATEAAEPCVAAKLSVSTADQEQAFTDSANTLLEPIDPPDHSVAYPVESNSTPVHLEV